MVLQEELKTMPFGEIWDAYCEKCGVPLLHIETDFGTGDEGQIRTRLEAYLEMIRAKKEARNG